MSCAYLTDQDIENIVRAAIRLDETGEQPTRRVIAAIADGDEDIPELIKNMAMCRFLLWTHFVGGVHILNMERELDLEDMGDKQNPLMRAILELRTKDYDLEFTEKPDEFRLYVEKEQMVEGVAYQREGGRLYLTLSAGEVQLMERDLAEEE